MGRDFEDARKQSLKALEEARGERDQAREEAKKQSGMADALTSRVEKLVTVIEAEKRENDLLRHTAVIEQQALQGWRKKCEGTPPSYPLSLVDCLYALV